MTDLSLGALYYSPFIYSPFNSLLESLYLKSFNSSLIISILFLFLDCFWLPLFSFIVCNNLLVDLRL